MISCEKPNPRGRKPVPRRRDNKLVSLRQLFLPPVSASLYSSHVDRSSLDTINADTFTRLQRWLTRRGICCPGRTEDFDCSFVHGSLARGNYSANFSRERVHPCSQRITRLLARKIVYKDRP